MTNPRIAVLAAISRPDWHPVSEAHGMPWGEAEALLGAYDASRDAVPSAPAETDEERADREETERDHARGDHTHCGLTCEVELPSEHLRNFVIAKGYPGTKGALDELLRRAREAAAPSVPADDGLRDRIAQALEEADYRPDMRRGDLADAILPVLPALTDRAGVLADIERAARKAGANCSYGRDDGCDYCTGFEAALEEVRRELRRLADEAQQAVRPTPGGYKATTGHAITCGSGFGMGCQCDDEPQQADEAGEA